MTDDLTEAFIRSAGKVFAMLEADEFRDSVAAGISAAFAEQDAERSRQRHARLAGYAARHQAMLASAERRYGPLDVLKERLLDHGGISARIMCRASYHEWAL